MEISFSRFVKKLSAQKIFHVIQNWLILTRITDKFECCLLMRWGYQILRLKTMGKLKCLLVVEEIENPLKQKTIKN